MKKLAIKDSVKRNLLKKSEININILKNLALNNFLYNSLNLNSKFILNSYKNSYFKTNITNKCIETLNKSKINNKLKFSRFSLYKLCRLNLIYGIQKYT